MRSKDFDEQEILRKAIQVFWQKGYTATSIHDLIDGLGIGRSSIYHAFGDKHSLFVKALELYQTEKTANIQRVIGEAASSKIAVETLLNSVIDDIIHNTCLKGCFKINAEVELASQDERINALVYKDDLVIENALHEAFKKGRLHGEIASSKDPLALARFFCSVVTGMRVYAKFRTERRFFEDIVNVALSVI